MGRQVRRVPIGFDWPMNKRWWGYLLKAIPCQTCDGSGRLSSPIVCGFPLKDGSWHTYESIYCPSCDSGDCYPKAEIPEGPGYQLWETVTEGSPISPAFETPEELAQWLTDNKAGVFGTSTLPYETWLKFIQGGGWAPSFVKDEKGFRSGVEAVVDMEA